MLYSAISESKEAECQSEIALCRCEVACPLLTTDDLLGGSCQSDRDPPADAPPPHHRPYRSAPLAAIRLESGEWALSSFFSISSWPSANMLKTSSDLLLQTRLTSLGAAYLFGSLSNPWGGISAGLHPRVSFRRLPDNSTLSKSC